MASVMIENMQERLLNDLVAIASAAGTLIMEIYSSDVRVRSKEDDSPVTDADDNAEILIKTALRKLTPDIPIVAEESTAAGEVLTVGNKFWLVDPLDGTKEFIQKSGEFTVNIALIENGEPTLGVVYAPALSMLFAGIVGQGAYVVEHGHKRPIRIREMPSEGITVVASRSHGNVTELESFLSNLKVAEFRNAGSSLKISLIASGEADLYPRFGRTMEWDIAAGHAVLRAAGGRLTDTQLVDFKYGKVGFENPHFIAFGAMLSSDINGGV